MKKCNGSRATEEDMQLKYLGKNRKLYRMHENEYRSNVELPENAVPPATFWISCWYSNEDNWNMSLRSRDLDQNFDRQFGTEVSTSVTDSHRKKEATEQLVLLMDDSSSPSRKKPLYSTPPASPHRKLPASAAKTPPAAEELDEFFAEAEKYVQKRFAEKYNYDIAKDLPLEGRYQWVRLHP